MNLAQRIVLIIGALAIVAMCLFPPWNFVYDPPSGLREIYVKSERPAGYHPLFIERTPQDLGALMQMFNLQPRTAYAASFITLQSFAMRVDTTRLGIQVGIVTMLTTLLFFILKPRRAAATPY